MIARYFAVALLIGVPLFAGRTPNELNIPPKTPNACMVAGINFPGCDLDETAIQPIQEDDTKEEIFPTPQIKQPASPQTVTPSKNISSSNMQQTKSSAMPKIVAYKPRSHRDVRRFRASRNKADEMCEMCNALPALAKSAQSTGPIYQESHDHEARDLQGILGSKAQ